MTPGLLLTGTFCALLLLATAAGSVVMVLKQLRGRPQPLRELVEACLSRLGAVETEQARLLKLIRSENARLSKPSRTRPVEPEPEEEEEDMTPPRGGLPAPSANGRTQEDIDWERLCGPAPTR